MVTHQEPKTDQLYRKVQNYASSDPRFQATGDIQNSLGTKAVGENHRESDSTKTWSKNDPET